MHRYEVTSPATGCRQLLFTPHRRDGPAQPAGCCVRRVRQHGRCARSAGNEIPLGWRDSRPPCARI